MDGIVYTTNGALELGAVIELYRASTLGERRPIADRTIMAAMMENANLIVTAWDGDKLVGIARTLTDFSYVAYLADLAVHADYQRCGIGTALIDKTRCALEPSCMITLLAAPRANDYYAKVGFVHHPRAWTLAPECVGSGERNVDAGEGLHGQDQS